jgi:pimeloyl-ACP methyl ester carboxylesterase
MDSPFQRPHSSLLVSEFPRAMGEMQAFAYSLPYLCCLPRGDGHCVLVLPGFSGGDPSTAALRWFLTNRGYRATPWRLGRNLGPTDHILDGMAALVEKLTGSGDRISIIGWSLGGIFARELGRTYPEAIRSIITLGSPFRLTGGDRDKTHASDAYEAMAALHSERAEAMRVHEDDRPPMTVPVTNIFSRTDGVVPWDSCIDTRGEQCENVEVPGSHSGFGHNPFALFVIADRLAQPEGSWQRYRVSGCLSSVMRVWPAPPVVAASPAVAGTVG